MRRENEKGSNKEIQHLKKQKPKLIFPTPGNTLLEDRDSSKVKYLEKISGSGPWKEEEETLYLFPNRFLAIKSNLEFAPELYFSGNSVKLLNVPYFPQYGSECKNIGPLDPQI